MLKLNLMRDWSVRRRSVSLLAMLVKVVKSPLAIAVSLLFISIFISMSVPSQSQTAPPAAQLVTVPSTSKCKDTVTVITVSMSGSKSIECEHDDHVITAEQEAAGTDGSRLKTVVVTCRCTTPISIGHIP